MNNPASSFRADAPRRWYRERWPWLLMAGPIAVVLASFASAWVAARTDDGVVAEDYYKRTPPAPVPIAGATLAVTGDRRAHVHLDAAVPPGRVQVTFARPGDRAHARRVDLAFAGDEWVGSLPELAPGLWIVTLESERWQLPTTVVTAPFSELALGTMHP